MSTVRTRGVVDDGAVVQETAVGAVGAGGIEPVGQEAGAGVAVVHLPIAVVEVALGVRPLPKPRVAR